VQFGAGSGLLNRMGIYLSSIWHGRGCWYCFGMTQLMPIKRSHWSGFGILRPPPTTPNGECHHCKDSHGACSADSDANFAVNVRPVDGASGCGRGLSRGVDVASGGLDVAVFKGDVILAVGVLDVVAELVLVDVYVVVELILVDVDVDVDVEIIPSSVETIAPSPFKTMPRFSAQHFGSLSQQKLPSEQVITRGRKPVPVTVSTRKSHGSFRGLRIVISRMKRTVLAYVGTVAPRVDSTSRDNCLSICHAETIGSAEVGCVAANVRTRTLCVIRITTSIPVVASNAFAGPTALLR
jgi:hypothetical protein